MLAGGGFVPPPMAPGMPRPYGAPPMPPFGPGYGFGHGCYMGGFGGPWGQAGLAAPPPLPVPQLQPPLGLPMPNLGVPAEMQQELTAKDQQLWELMQQAASIMQTLQVERHRAATSAATSTAHATLTMPPEAAAELKCMQDNLASTAAEGTLLAADIANAAQISEQLHAWFESNKEQMRGSDEAASPSQYLQMSVAGLKQQMDGLMARWAQIQTVFDSADPAPASLQQTVGSATQSQAAIQPAVTVSKPTLAVDQSGKLACQKGHCLLHFVNQSGHMNLCNLCSRKEIRAPEHLYRCEPCDFDVCQQCYSNVSAQVMAPSQSSSSATTTQHSSTASVVRVTASPVKVSSSAPVVQLASSTVTQPAPVGQVVASGAADTKPAVIISSQIRPAPVQQTSSAEEETPPQFVSMRISNMQALSPDRVRQAPARVVNSG